MAFDPTTTTELDSTKIGYFHTGELAGTGVKGIDLVRLVNEEFKGTPLEMPIDESRLADIPILIPVQGVLYAFALDTVLEKQGITDIRTASPAEVMQLMHSYLCRDKRLAGFSMVDIPAGVVLYDEEDPNQEYAQHLCSEFKKNGYRELIEKGVPLFLSKLRLSKHDASPNKLRLDLGDETVVEPAPSLKANNWYGVFLAVHPEIIATPHISKTDKNIRNRQLIMLRVTCISIQLLHND